ncbi:MAG: DinB family protein [Lachnospiraceae bacterium]
MLDIEKDWNPKIEQLRKLIKSPKNFESAITLALEIHAIPHTKVVSSSSTATFGDDLLNGLADKDYSVMPTKKDETIAWHLWHITRIEDLTGNLLIAEQGQIFNDDWMQKMNVAIKDTGNIMKDNEIIDFSQRINKSELINYRNRVGSQTRQTLKSLTPDDLRRKPNSEYLERLISEGGLLEKKGSLWLKDFWGQKTVSGLILLPLTRHQMMHLSDSIRIKEYIKSSAE